MFYFVQKEFVENIFDTVGTDKGDRWLIVGTDEGDRWLIVGTDEGDRWLIVGTDEDDHGLIVLIDQGDRWLIVGTDEGDRWLIVWTDEDDHGLIVRTDQGDRCLIVGTDKGDRWLIVGTDKGDHGLIGPRRMIGWYSKILRWGSGSQLHNLGLSLLGVAGTVAGLTNQRRWFGAQVRPQNPLCGFVSQNSTENPFCTKGEVSFLIESDRLKTNY